MRWNIDVVQVRGIMSLRPLDDIFPSEDVHLLKIDVEGFEKTVLKGAKNLMSSKRVKYLISEANTALRGKQGSLGYIRYVRPQPAHAMCHLCDIGILLSSTCSQQAHRHPCCYCKPTGCHQHTNSALTSSLVAF
jgi:hypothetical protein